MNRDEIEAANTRIVEAGAFVQPLLAEAGKVIVGQHYLMERLVISLLANVNVNVKRQTVISPNAGRSID